MLEYTPNPIMATTLSEPPTSVTAASVRHGRRFRCPLGSASGPSFPLGSVPESAFVAIAGDSVQSGRLVALLASLPSDRPPPFFTDRHA